MIAGSCGLLGFSNQSKRDSRLLFWGAALDVMDRLVLSDQQWDRISGLIIGRPDQRGSTGRDNRMFVEGGARARALDRPHCSALAWPAGSLRRVEQCVSALQPLEPERRLAACLRSHVG